VTSLGDLRHFAATHTLFTPTTLKRAIAELAFVQADPIRAPARAQDLILRQRVAGYRAGDLERRYAKLGVEEDFFINYGFVTASLHALMHPRPGIAVPAGDGRPWPAARRKRAGLLLAFVRERGAVHPREVDERFAHGSVTNYWGGSSRATTHLLDAMHYRGMLRIARREGGVRIYAGREPASTDAILGPEARAARLDALIDIVVRIYAPLPAPSLPFYARRLRFAVPQWKGELGAAIARAKARLSRARIGGVDWYWSGEAGPNPSPGKAEPDDRVRLLAPFDPVVQDRTRFELLWGWVYRFEAYTPVPKRKLGYYALPLLWRDRVIGWGNLAMKDGVLTSELGYVAGRPPRDRAFRRELEAELERVRVFLGLENGPPEPPRGRDAT
jgi:uncharacterized protein YcaQ